MFKFFMINNEKPRLRTRRWDERGNDKRKIYHAAADSFPFNNLLWAMRHTERDSSLLLPFLHQTLRPFGAAV